MSDKWSEYCKQMNEPVTELLDHNTATLNNLSKNMKSITEDMLQAKCPEDFVATFMRLANMNSLEALKYSQGLMSILMRANTSSRTEAFTEAMKEAATKLMKLPGA